MQRRSCRARVGSPQACAITLTARKSLIPRRRAAAPPRLTALQLAVMQVLWSRDEASVTDVQRAMTGRRLAVTVLECTADNRPRHSKLIARRQERYDVVRE